MFTLTIFIPPVFITTQRLYRIFPYFSVTFHRSSQPVHKLPVTHRRNTSRKPKRLQFPKYSPRQTFRHLIFIQLSILIKPDVRKGKDILQPESGLLSRIGKKEGIKISNYNNDQINIPRPARPTPSGRQMVKNVCPGRTKNMTAKSVPLWAICRL